MNIEQLRESSDVVTARISSADSALVLGSGWGDVIADWEEKESVDYSAIPCLGATSVKGHAGRMVLTEQAGKNVLVFQGRRHWYEGAGWESIAFPMYLCETLGVSTVVLTNAAGGINEAFSPGTLMIIDDHINAMGANPLSGPHNEVWGPRFPDQGEVYDKRLRSLLDAAGDKAGLKPAHGVYIAVSGPTYETPAEVNAYRTLGADAIGMSTVPEAMLANAAGISVAGISCITNCAAGITGSPLTHDEVIAETENIQPKMKALLSGFFQSL